MLNDTELRKRLEVSEDSTDDEHDPLRLGKSWENWQNTVPPPADLRCWRS